MCPLVQVIHKKQHHVKGEYYGTGNSSEYYLGISMGWREHCHCNRSGVAGDSICEENEKEISIFCD